MRCQVKLQVLITAEVGIHDLKKVVDHVAKLLNYASKRKFQPLEKTTSLKHTGDEIESFPYEFQEELQSRALTQSRALVGICDVIFPVFGRGTLYS